MNDTTPENNSAAGGPTTEPIVRTDNGLETGMHPESLSNTEIAKLSRERLETLLSILPPPVAAILITNRPPMPAHVEYAAHRKLIHALAKARGKIPSVPMDKKVDYTSKRTGEHVHYSFASLDSIHKTITKPLSEHGLVLECIFNENVIAVLLSHEDGGIHLSWLPLPAENDIKDLATQITMRRRYLTTQIIAIVADEDTAERDIAEPKKSPQRRAAQQGTQRQGAAASPKPRNATTTTAAGGRKQTPIGGEQLANRTNGLLAKLPAEVAERLQEQYNDPNELLRRTTEELNRRNSARARGGEAGAGEPPANERGTATEESPPADPKTEKHINDGMRALELSTDEQAKLRNQFKGNAKGLLEHVKALYNARHENERNPDNEDHAR